MRKRLHIALAVWKSGKPFAPDHYPWDPPAHLPPKGERRSEVAARSETQAERAARAACGTESTQAAGHKNPVLEPERSVVTAACGSSSVPQAPAVGNASPAQDAAAGPPPIPASDISMSPTSPRSEATTRWIDFDHRKSQLPLQRVLDHLDVLDTLRGTAHQRRGPCPLHDHGKRKGRTFRVQLDKNVFQCFDPNCGIKGDVIDLWAALKGLPLREAALELVTMFNLEPAPRTEKRHG